MATPDVSFVIAAYRAADSVGAAVESALAQRGVEVEVIVIDDASPDRSSRFLCDHISDRVIFRERETNGGPGAARNDAIALASGRWIAVLDADDVVEPDRACAMIETAKSFSSEVVVDNQWVEDAANGRNTTFRRPMFPTDIWSSYKSIDARSFIDDAVMFGRTHGYGYLKPLFSRDFIMRHGLRYDEDLRIGEDYDLMVQAFAHGAQCAVHSACGYVYRITDGSISRVLTLDHVREMKRADAVLAASSAGQRMLRDPAIEAAARRRTRSLVRAENYLQLVAAIKDWRPDQMISTTLRDPSAALLLRLPVVKRVSRAWHSLAKHVPVRQVEERRNVAAGQSEDRNDR